MVGFGGAGSFDVKGDGAIGDAVGGGVGVEDEVNAGLGVGVAAPGLGSTGGVFNHGSRVDNDGEVEVVEGVAAGDGVLIKMGVVARGGEDGVEPMIVTAVGHLEVGVDGGDDAQIQSVVVHAIVRGIVDGVEVVAGSGEGVAKPNVITAGVDGVVVGLGAGEGEVEVVDAVAFTRTDGSVNGVAVEAGEQILGTAPSEGAASAVDGLIVDVGVVDGEVEDEEGVVGGIDVVDHGVAGVCLTVGSPCESTTGCGIVGDNGALCVVLG